MADRMLVTQALDDRDLLVDPLDVQKKVSQLREKRDTLISELDTQIKVSNATTFIEV